MRVDKEKFIQYYNEGYCCSSIFELLGHKVRNPNQAMFYYRNRFGLKPRGFRGRNLKLERRKKETAKRNRDLRIDALKNKISYYKEQIKVWEKELRELKKVVA